jgi:hypothetical protein
LRAGLGVKQLPEPVLRQSRRFGRGC